jgi:hypothetical protein
MFMRSTHPIDLQVIGEVISFLTLGGLMTTTVRMNCPWMMHFDGVDGALRSTMKVTGGTTKAWTTADCFVGDGYYGRGECTEGLRTCLSWQVSFVILGDAMPLQKNSDSCWHPTIVIQNADITTVILLVAEVSMIPLY